MRIGDNIASEFNEFSVNYTQDMIGVVPHYKALISCFINDLPQGFWPKTILDLGCGNGNVTAQLLQIFPTSTYSLLDASEEMIRLCKQRFAGYNIEYVASYFQDFDFDKYTFDMITAGFSLHHVNATSKQNLFKQIHKALVPGGIFGYSDLMIDKNSPEHSQLLQAWEGFVLNSFSDGEKWEWLMEHYREFDKPDNSKVQVQWLEQAGFNQIEVTAFEKYWVHIRATK